MNTKPFLLEIGCEELPTQSLLPLSKALAAGIEQELSAANLEHKETQIFVTPRRIAVLIDDVSTTQPSRESERQGPSYDSAYDKNKMPTLACLGFASSCGVTADQLKVKDTPKGKRVFCVVKEVGKSAMDLLPDIVNKAIKKLPIPRPMRWGDHEFSFVRPVRWVVTLLGRDVVRATILGKQTGRETQGHRFHHPKSLSITDPKDYSVILSQAHVIADYQSRKDLIQKHIKQAVKTNNHAVIDENLLDEVTALVEWPVVLTGEFNKAFLTVPKEVLMTSMETHIKCFPVENSNGELQSTFIIVSNIDSKNPNTVIQGYESVINARLSDAAFFYNNDLKTSLDSHLESLKDVIFQKQLGNMEDRSSRISKLANYIAEKISADASIAQRAGLLSKCDLVSEMVTEFPKLQGIMGCYYARNDKESEACATAIKEQYLPKFSGDVLPKTLEGAAVALAARLDTLVGILGINKQPTGDKDPFALRRAALGILRILIEKALPLDLIDLLKEAQKQYANVNFPNNELLEQAFSFFMSRLKAWYVEQGVAPEVFESVLACHPTAPLDFHKRIQAVQQFQNLPEASALAAANKRVRNILKKTDKRIPEKLNTDLMDLDEEKNLAAQIEAQTKTVDDLYKNSDYTKALTTLSTLKEPVDAFFDHVMIMDEDLKKRENRLALLSSLQHLFTQVADISLLP